MQLGPYSGPLKCYDCGKPKHLTEVKFRRAMITSDYPDLVLCDACVVTLEKLLLTERSRPHLRTR